MLELSSVADAAPEAASPRRTRLGLCLFAVYVLLYGGFVLLNALAPDRMQATPWFGLNVAVLYGLGLIVAAFVLALIYDMLCRRSESSGDGPGGLAG